MEGARKGSSRQGDQDPHGCGEPGGDALQAPRAQQAEACQVHCPGQRWQLQAGGKPGREARQSPCLLYTSPSPRD
eukprot:5310151-Alexandrium_andersonii.AAC.1